jgi:hypothetical protein
MAQLTARKATVQSFRPEEAVGSLVFEDGQAMDFSSTCFVSGRPTRFPREGEAVEVLFSEEGKSPLRVRSIDDKD